MSNVLILCPNTALEITYFLDSFFSSEQLTATKRYWEAGGKGVNVAKILTDMGVQASVVGCIGGLVGQLIKSQLSQHNVKYDFAETLVETRCSLIIKDKKAVKIIREQGFDNDEQAEEILFSLVNDKIDSLDHLCLCGSLPKKVGNSFYKEVISLCNKKNIKTYVDTSKAALLASLEANPFLLKPNKVEAEEVVGRKLTNTNEQINALRTFNDLGAGNVVMTLDENGSIALIDGVVYKVTLDSLDVTCINPVGAGDAMLAGLVYGFINGMEPCVNLQQASAIAASSVTYPYSGKINKIEYKKYMKAIKVNDY